MEHFVGHSGVDSCGGRITMPVDVRSRIYVKQALVAASLYYASYIEKLRTNMNFPDRF